MTSLTAPGRPRFLDRTRDTPTWWRRVDLLLVGVVVAIACSGVLMVYSSTRAGFGESGYAGFAIRQTVWLFVGLVLMTLVMVVDYRKFARWAAWVYLGALAVLLAVISPLGSSSKGAQAWFAVGGFQLQPSEFSKIVVIIALAAYAARQRERLDGRLTSVMVAIAAVPMALILLQPDLGTTLVFAVIAFALLTVAGASGRALLALVTLVLLVAVAVIQFGVLKQYQLDRLGAFLDPNSNTQHAAYNLNQSKIAIGSGGLFGKGLFLGGQTNLRYVPEQHTDFIFTVVGEELGLLGSGTLLALFAVLMWRIWQAAKQAPDAFGTYLCVGVLAMFAFQLFENVGMTMGIMPITGIPLPLVSYGGSAMLASFVALGLVLNVRFRSDSSSN
jgi:rod shape determining protein RodA